MAENQNYNNNEGMTEQEKRELKNSVLQAKQAAEGNPHSVSQEQYTKQELGFEIPTDSVPLPSEGKIYPPNHPLHNANKLDYRAMTAKEEDILMSQALIKKGTVVTELIRSCLVDRTIDVNSMISGDRNAAMIAIRISGYGRNYDPSFMCPNCETNNELNIDLAELPIKHLQIEPAEDHSNIFHFKLPVTKKTVGFRFLTGEEEESILKTLQTKKKKGIANDNTVTTKLLSQIVEIDGVKDQSQISKFVGFMPARDSLALREYINDTEPGVDMTIPFECVNCEYTHDIQLPIGPSFFWPNTRR